MSVTSFSFRPLWESTAKPQSLSPSLNTGSPLYFTTYDEALNPQDFPFLVSSKINYFVERFGETEGGPLMMSGLVGLTLFKMATYYGLFQPSYLWGFQQKYSRSWKVGHHLYGHDAPNPLRK